MDYHSFKHALIVALLLVWGHISFSQEADSTQAISHFSGKISITHNGISLIPSFSLDAPAVLFNLSMGGERLTFEPEMRFALDGKPWSFLFWWRYKAVQSERFNLRVGAHPALNFRTIPVSSNGVERDVIETRRFLAGELAPSFKVSDNVSLGAYYLYALGLDESQRHTHFVNVNAAFAPINLPKNFYLGIFPNAYYLRMDDLDGFYVSASLTLANKKCPISVSAILNKSIQTEIQPERDFVWNVSLVYSFNKEYIDYSPTL